MGVCLCVFESVCFCIFVCVYICAKKEYIFANCLGKHSLYNLLNTFYQLSINSQGFHQIYRKITQLWTYYSENSLKFSINSQVCIKYTLKLPKLGHKTLKTPWNFLKLSINSQGFHQICFRTTQLRTCYLKTLRKWLFSYRNDISLHENSKWFNMRQCFWKWTKLGTFTVRILPMHKLYNSYYTKYP